MGETKPWHRRCWVWALLGFFLLCAALLLALDPIAEHYTRRALQQAEDITGTFDDVDVSIVPLQYTIKALTLRKRSAESQADPLFNANSISVRVLWSSLLGFDLVAEAEIHDPRLVMENVKEKAPAERPPDVAEPPPDVAEPPPDLSDVLREAPPLLLRRVEIFNGEVLFTDTTVKGNPRIWLHDLEAAVEHVATRPDIADNEPILLTLKGGMQRSGSLSALITADPWREGLNFSGRFDLQHLKASDLYQLIAPTTGLQATGSIAMYAEFDMRDSQITGGVKPVLTNIDVQPAEDDLLTMLLAWKVDVAVELLSDDREEQSSDAEREVIAAVVPITGSVRDPNTQLMPTLLGIIRNAFVAGLAHGFSYLPPRTAEEGTSSFQQFVDAMNKDKGPPKAEPDE